MKVCVDMYIDHGSQGGKGKGRETEGYLQHVRHLCMPVSHSK